MAVPDEMNARFAAAKAKLDSAPKGASAALAPPEPEPEPRSLRLTNLGWLAVNGAEVAA